VSGTLDSVIEKLLITLLGGGPTAIIAVLVIIIVFLVMERKRLLKEIEKKDDKIDRIIDDYYKGNMTISEAFNSLKMVLFEIKGKL
jgi:cell division protein FtsL